MSRRNFSKTTKTAVANIAPRVEVSAPLYQTSASLKTLRQNKHNPLPSLKPEMLSRVLESFEHGYLREAALLWEKIAERDDMIAGVKAKREKDVSQLDMQVVTLDESAEADAHQEVLERFWKSVRAVNAYDRNETGGFRRLVKQMMTAVSYKYAAHHIIWQTTRGGELKATFEFVPLWLFENTTGKLRYLNAHGTLNGEILAENEWMTTCGDGLMMACSIGYLAKRSAMNDWLIFSEKFSVPGVLGRTSAKAGSPEAVAMEDAVRAFGHDWVAVITGDDGTHAKPVEIIQAAGNPSGMPMPAVVERVDRRIAALYRGADLSSMSSGAEAKGTGASLQDKETDILRRDDAETISETLESVSRMVIEWQFGNGTEPLARVELVVPVQEDMTAIVNAATQLSAQGMRVSLSALAERINIPLAADDEDALGVNTPAVTLPGAKVISREPLENAQTVESVDALRDALTRDMKPLGDALYSAVTAADEPAMQAALKQITVRMPELAGQVTEVASELARQMGAAWLGAEGEEVENGDFKGHPFRGNQWNNRSKGTGKPKKAKAANKIADVIEAAFDDPDNRDFCDYHLLKPTDIAAIEARAGRAPAGVETLAGYRRTLEAEKVTKILSKHSKDKYPITEADFEMLPMCLNSPAEQTWEVKPGQTPRLVSTIRRGRDLLIVEEVQTGNRRLTVLSMYRP